MSTQPIYDQIRTFLRDNFPDATIDDEYYFVSVRAPARQRIKHEGLNAVAAKLCSDGCWLVAVNVDGVPDIQSLQLESRPITYKPDWNIEERFTQWLASVSQAVDLEQLLRSATLPSALALISPTLGVVLDVSFARVHARSEEELRRFLHGLEQWVEPS